MQSRAEREQDNRIIDIVHRVSPFRMTKKGVRAWWDSRHEQIKEQYRAAEEEGSLERHLTDMISKSKALAQAHPEVIGQKPVESRVQELFYADGSVVRDAKPKEL